jgi:hypothetical protein
MEIERITALGQSGKKLPRPPFQLSKPVISAMWKTQVGSPFKVGLGKRPKTLS